MINTETEALVHFQEAPAHVPSKPHINTLHRWRLKGVGGRKLDTILIGGRRYTSLQAIQRFLQSGADKHPEPEAPIDIARRAKEAGRALEAIGA